MSRRLVGRDAGFSSWRAFGRRDVEWSRWFVIATMMLSVGRVEAAVLAPDNGAALPAIARAHLSFVAQSGTVQVRYELSAAVSTLRFDTGGSARAISWSPVAPAASLAQDGMSIDFGTPTRSFTVALKPFARDGQIDRVYSPVILFDANRAAAVYSPYLSLDRSAYRTEIHAPSGLAVADGIRRYGAAPVWDTSSDATYLVLGALTTTEYPTHRLSIDPQLPPWVAAFARQFDRIIGVYDTAFGADGVARPWILMTYGDPTSSGSLFRGDTLPGFVRLNFIGSEWTTETTESKTSVQYFVAHELFHLWNGKRFQAPSSRESLWLLEGGADAVASDIVSQLGQIGDAERLARRNDALRLCSATPGATLKDKIRGGGNAAYRCGAALFYLAGWSAPTRHGGPPSITALWQGLFDAAQRRDDRTYGPNDFLQTLRGPTGAPAPPVFEALGALIDRDADWNETLARDAALFGLERTTDDEADAKALSGLLASRLVFDLMRVDCRSGYGFFTEGTTLRVDPNSSCATFDRPYRLASIDGHRSRHCVSAITGPRRRRAKDRTA